MDTTQKQNLKGNIHTLISGGNPSDIDIAKILIAENNNIFSDKALREILKLLGNHAFDYEFLINIKQNRRNFKIINFI